MVTGDRRPQRRRPQVVNLQAVRVARLGRTIGRCLEDGHAIADVSTVTNVVEWRKAARAVASSRGWRVRTGVTRDGKRVWAVRVDRETTDEDRSVLRDRLGYLSALLGLR